MGQACLSSCLLILEGCMVGWLEPWKQHSWWDGDIQKHGCKSPVVILILKIWDVYSFNSNILRNERKTICSVLFVKLSTILMEIKLAISILLYILLANLNKNIYCCLVTKLCPSLCEPMECSTPGPYLSRASDICPNSWSLLRWHSLTISSSAISF